MGGANMVTYNNKPVATGFPSSFQSDDGLVQIQYNGQGGTLQESRAGKAMHVLHITLPDGISLQVNQWNEASEGPYMNARITMPAQPGQDGHCGNFNGNPADDDRTQVRARVGTQGVPAGMLLFPGGKTPIAPGNRPDINNCPEDKLAGFKTECDDAGATSMECLIDRCFGGGAVR